MQFPSDWAYSKKIVINSGMVDGSSNISDYGLLINESVLSTAQKTEIFGNSQGKEINSNWLLNHANLQGYWRLESDGTDESSNGYDLSATGTNSHVSAKFGNGLDSDASASNYYSLSSVPNLQITGDATVSFWINPDAIGSTMIPVSVQGGGETEAVNALIYPQIDSDGTLTWIHEYGAGSNETVSFSEITLEAGNWYHIVFVRDSVNKTISLYVNGQRFTQSYTNQATGGGSSPMNIGGANGGAAGFDGKIDDVAILDTALSEHEVYSLYTGGADVRFFIKSGGVDYIVPHAMIDWDITNETFSAVVKTPTLYDASDTEIGLVYGNSDATPYGRELGLLDGLHDDANLEGYWKLESDGTDESANNNDLTATGSPSFVSAIFGNGVDLEESTPQYLSIADASQSGLDIIGDISFSAWVKFESLPTLAPIVSKWDTNSQRSYRFGINSSGILRAEFSDDGSSSGTHYVRYDASRVLTTGKWYHVAFTFDISTETCNIYIDGIADSVSLGAGTTLGASIHNGTAPFALGQDFSSGGSGNDFDGVIDDAAIFSRELTAVEIASIYGATGGAFRSSIKGFWPFNGHGKDLTVYGHDFTDFNGGTFVTGNYGLAIDFERDNSEYWSVPSADAGDLQVSTSTDRTLLLLSKNEDVAYSKNENMFGFLNTGNSIGCNIRIAQNTRTYGLTDPINSSFWVTQGNNTLRASDDDAFNLSGEWVFWGGAIEATTSSGEGNTFVDGDSHTDTHTATPSSLSGLDFSIGRSGEFAGNYGDFIADLAWFYAEYLSADEMGTMHENIENMTTHVTVSEFLSSDERDSEVSGKESVDDDRDSEVTGKVSVNDEVDSEITGIRNYSDRNSEITGVNMAETDERDSEITGLIPSDERDTEITGIFDDGVERDSETTGKEAVNNERDTEIEGSLPFSTRASEIIGKQNKELPRFYRILVKDENGDFIGEFDKFRTLKFGKRMNNFGMASFEVPVTDEKATDLINLRVYTVWIYRQEDADSTLVWAGEQAMRDVELDDNGAGWVTIYCYTWLEQLKDRFTDAEEEYDGIDAGEIAWDLIDTSQTPSNADFGITEGSITATVNRDRTYYNQNIMEAIINLANVASGFDFEITDEKVFNVYDVMGEDKTDEVVFEYGTNISSLRITEDFVTPVNRGIVLGVATDETTLQRVEYDDVTLQGTYKIRESVLNEMDVSESATLEDKGEALVRKYGSKLIKIEPRMTKSAAVNITSFGIGDVIRLVIEHGIYDIDEDYRVFEWEVTYNSDNSEDLALVLGNFTL